MRRRRAMSKVCKFRMPRSIITASWKAVPPPGSLHTPRHLACLFEKQQLCTRPHILRGDFLINVARKIRRSLFAKNVQPCAKLFYFLGRDEVLNAQFVFLPSGSLHVYIRLQPGQVRWKTVQFKTSAKRQHCRRAVLPLFRQPRSSGYGVPSNYIVHFFSEGKRRLCAISCNSNG